jgi:uncharacterized PurR-regulated membrane protein YhhQ (DUF165 family)
MKHDNDIIFYPKYLSLLNSINCLCMLFPVILSRKLVIIPIIGLVPASVLFTATYFVIFSIVAEVYGYKEAQKTMINGLIVHSIFTWVMQIIIHTHPDSQNMTSLKFDTSNAYNLIFGRGIYLVWFSLIIFMTIAGTINNRLMIKMKFLWKGKSFLLRFLISTFAAMMLFGLLSNISNYYTQITNGTSIILCLTEFLTNMGTKAVNLIILTIPTLVIVNYLKNAEHITHELKDIKILTLCTKK